MKHVFIALFLFLAACSGENKKADQVSEPEKKVLPVVAINDKLESRVLKSSEFMEVERVVRLETRKDVLLPASSGPILAGKYILTLDMNNLRQFSAEGKFIRILSSAGKGPGEYYAMTCFVADRVNNLFYFSHRGDREYIQVIDLNTGNRLPKIKFPDELLKLDVRVAVSKLHLVNDSTFLCVIRMLPDNPYSFFYMSTKGEFLRSMKINEDVSTVMAGLPTPYCRIIGDQLYYLGPNADTLYTIRNSEKTPFCVFDMKNKLSVNNIEGNTRDLSGESNSFAIMNTINFGLYRAPDGTIMADPKKIQSPVRYYIDYRNFTASIIAGYEFEYFGFKGFFGSPNNGKMVVTMQAEAFKENARKVLKENTAPPEVLKRVKELDAQITENDNPILIIGKMK